MKIFFYLVVVCSALLSFGLSAEVVDKIIAKVGSEVITLSDVAQALSEQRHFFTEKLGKVKGEQEFANFRQNALDEMILQKILLLEIKKEGIQVSDAEIDQEYKGRINQFGMTESEFMTGLAKEGITLPAYKNGIRQELERQQFLQKKIVPNINMSDYDLQKEYEGNIAKFQIYNKLHFIEVYLTPDKFSSEDELSHTAKLIEAKLKAGQPVADIIKKYSSGAFAANGGDSGLVDAADLRVEIQTVLAKMNVGEISPAMVVGNGVFIFKLIAKSDPQPQPIGKVMPQLRAQYGDKLVNQELKKYLMTVREQTYVEVMK